jgi:hypothetical protein
MIIKISRKNIKSLMEFENIPFKIINGKTIELQCECPQQLSDRTITTIETIKLQLANIRDFSDRDYIEYVTKNDNLTVEQIDAIKKRYQIEKEDMMPNSKAQNFTVVKLKN